MFIGSILLDKFPLKEISIGVSVRHGGALDLDLEENIMGCLSAGFGKRSSNHFTVTYSLCDFEQVTWPFTYLDSLSSQNLGVQED